jgi:hypothetical protein
LALLAILAVGFNFWLDYRRDQARGEPGPFAPPRSLEGQVAAESARFPVEGLSDAVFLVVVEGKAAQQRYGSATAFLVDDKCGIFATNAHVAETLTPDSRIVLRQPGTDVELEVTAAKVHPAYLRMREIFDETGPILEYRRTKKGQEYDNSVPSLQFDFGLLYVQANPGDKDCKLPEGVTLPKALKLAPADSLAQVKAGDPIAIVGYPGSGNFSATLAPLAALPRVDFGTIRAIGSTLPAAKPGPFEHTLLDTVLFHSAATIGGSSGSPVINSKGEVIAVHARGIAANGGGRSYQEGGADGIEALKLMLDGTAEGALPQYAAAISARVKEYVPLAAYARSIAMDSVKSTAKKYGMREEIGSSGLLRTQFGDAAEAGCLGQRKDCVYAESITRDFRLGRFAFVDIPVDTAKANIVGAVDFDLDVDISALSEDVRRKFTDMRAITFMCPMMLVQLEPAKDGDGYLFARESDLETFPTLLIPAEHKGQRSIKVALFRPLFCSAPYTRAQVVVTPFELLPGPPKQENVSMIDQLSGALADAVNSMGDAVLPANWRDHDEAPRR